MWSHEPEGASWTTTYCGVSDTIGAGAGLGAGSGAGVTWATWAGWAGSGSGVGKLCGVRRPRILATGGRGVAVRVCQAANTRACADARAALALGDFAVSISCSIARIFASSRAKRSASDGSGGIGGGLRLRSAFARLTAAEIRAACRARIESKAVRRLRRAGTSGESAVFSGGLAVASMIERKHLDGGNARPKISNTTDAKIRISTNIQWKGECAITPCDKSAAQ